MSKVRLYHLARNWDVPSSDIIDTLASKGRRLKSHFVEVDSSEVPEIRAILQEAGFFGAPEPRGSTQFGGASPLVAEPEAPPAVAREREPEPAPPPPAK